MKNNDIKLQLARHGVVKTRTLIPSIPLAFEELIGDVLKVKPPVKVKDEPRQNKRRAKAGLKVRL